MARGEETPAQKRKLLKATLSAHRRHTKTTIDMTHVRRRGGDGTLVPCCQQSRASFHLNPCQQNRERVMEAVSPFFAEVRKQAYDVDDFYSGTPSICFFFRVGVLSGRQSRRG